MLLSHLFGCLILAMGLVLLPKRASTVLRYRMRELASQSASELKNTERAVGTDNVRTSDPIQSWSMRFATRRGSCSTSIRLPQLIGLAAAGC